MGELGHNLWRAGQSKAAVVLLEEAISKLALADANTAAARHRIKLSTILRQLGRQEDAATLPKEDSLPVVLHRHLLAEKARLELGAEKPGNAVATCRTLLCLWRTEPEATAEIAAAESLLAMACLEAGDKAQAELLARKASAVLGPWQHPENICCLITLALAQGGNPRQAWTAGWVDEGVQQLQADPLHPPAEKARLFESEANRLQRRGRPEEADLLRSAAFEQWQMVGTGSKPAVLAHA
jgi:hypothetical protein